MTTKELAAYLPYGLIGVADFLPNTPFIVDLLKRNRVAGETKEGNNVPIGCTFKQFKPYLFDLSMLAQDITINGETFVPMLELLKIAITDFDDNEGEITAEMINEIELNDLSITASLNEDITCKLLYSKSKIKFTFISPQDLWRSCSYGLIQKLLEWKFDIFNIIERGDAIAVSESFNPYK